jgi:hypothetical protein
MSQTAKMMMASGSDRQYHAPGAASQQLSIQSTRISAIAAAAPITSKWRNNVKLILLKLVLPLAVLVFLYLIGKPPMSKEIK